jgi:tetratricopeptide (TPR) repeat protein
MPSLNRSRQIVLQPSRHTLRYDSLMTFLRTVLMTLLLAAGSATSVTFAQDANLKPKFGEAPKSDMQKAADAKFLAGVDEYYKGDRKKAANDLSSRGWQFLRQGNKADAMRRFNQAWMIDNSSGSALWGMAAIQAEAEDIATSMKLFSEAERFVGDDVDFAVDYAKTLGLAGAETKDEVLVKQALTRFARLHERAPQHTLNLQNWAITLYYVGNYRDAWQKIQLAEGTPRRAEIDQSFVSELQRKMPRP